MQATRCVRLESRARLSTTVAKDGSSNVPFSVMFRSFVALLTLIMVKAMYALKNLSFLPSTRDLVMEPHMLERLVSLMSEHEVPL